MRSGTASATAEIVLPPHEWPTSTTLPLPTPAALFTTSTTWAVRCAWVTLATGETSVAKAFLSSGRFRNEAGNRVREPAPGRSTAKAA